MSREYCIVTDATADLPLHIVEQFSIEVIPMECSLDTETYLYDPTHKNLDPKNYYEKMREGAATSTSQINVFTYNSFFAPILQSGRDIFYIAFSSGLTGSQQSAQIAINDLLTKYPDRKITMVDSFAAALGEGLLVYAAAQKKGEGMEMEALVEWVTENRQHCCHWFTVDDLKYLVRGGRLSSTAAFFGKALSIKPVLHVDEVGHLVALSKARGRKKSLKELVDLMKDTYRPEIFDAIFIGHADCPEDAEYVQSLIKKELGKDVLITDYIGPVIGAHAGPGTLALFHFGTHK